MIDGVQNKLPVRFGTALLSNKILKVKKKILPTHIQSEPKVKPKQQALPISLNIVKLNYIQGGKGVKGPSEEMLIFVFDDFYVIACDLKIQIYKINSPYKQKVYSLELFVVLFRE